MKTNTDYQNEIFRGYPMDERRVRPIENTSHRQSVERRLT